MPVTSARKIPRDAPRKARAMPPRYFALLRPANIPYFRGAASAVRGGTRPDVGMSIRARLLLLVALATLVPGILIGVRFVAERNAAIERATAELSAAARSVAGDIDEKIRGTAQLHYGLARARDLDTRDRAACSAFLAAVRQRHPQYTGILTIDPDGRLFCDSLGTGRALDLNDREYFVRAKTMAEGVALQPAIGRLTGISVLQIAFPARDADGKLKFVLLASLNLKQISDALLRQQPDAEILMIDRHGAVLIWSPGPDRAARVGTSVANSELHRLAMAPERGGVREIPGARGRPRVWAAAAGTPELDSGLRILIGALKTDLVAPANRRFTQDLLLLAVVSAIMFAAVWILAEVGIRRQVARIGAMATKLGQGDLGARIAPPYPRGELGALMALLNRAAESLEAQRAAIGELNVRLRQSQKMEAVGQLTGGVAHDFNNLLTVIIGNSELVADGLRDRPALRNLAEMTVKAAERGAELTSRLLAFSRRQPLDPKPSDINRQIADMDPMLRRTLGEHIEIELVRGGGLWKAMVDPGQLENAILNLCLNARDAMPNGGRLTIETANAHLDAAYAASQSEVEPGQYVMIAVSDTGTGMDAATLERAFEPFFTTKDVGKGSGLGLSMVYGFVKQSRGHVRIYSESGQGTTVRLYLPRADGEAQAGAPAAAPAEADRGSGRILLVEDDALVRENAAELLRSLGYDVVPAANGPEALAVLEKGEAFDLLLTDVVMPGGLNGRELAERAHALRPGLLVLYTSGYTENAIVHHGRLDRGVELLAKPYRRQDLAAKVRAVLAAAKARA
jgi:signal transduction histidine kinase/ActR/RegA family two-component response regulator